MSFAQMKRRTTDFDALQKTFEKTTKKNYDDPRFYYPERDEIGNASVEIRFLPATDPDAQPFSKHYLHRFKGPAAWFWHKCRTSLGEDDCPVCNANREMVAPFDGKWDNTPKSVKDVVSPRSRKLIHFANIYVVRDKNSPEKEGKVFLFQFGKTVMDKIRAAIKPEFEGDPQFNPFDPWTGANFNLRIKKVDKQTNYDSCTWGNRGPLFGDDDAIEALASQLYDLSEFDKPEGFTSAEVQVKAYARAMGNTASVPAATVRESAPAAPTGRTQPAPAPAVDEKASTNAELEALFNTSDMDDDIPY